MSAPRLTDEQSAIVARSRGDAVVLAGAGSGKTTVLTERFVEVVRARGLTPRDVAALTFTDRAANEMRSRIGRALARSQDAAVRALAPDVEFAPISTIHAFCARVLRENAIEAGVDPAFSLADEVEARLLLEDAFRLVERAAIRAHDGRQAVLRRLGGADPTDVLTTLHETLRGLGFPPRAARLATGPTSADIALAEVDRALERLDHAAAMSPPPSEHAEAFALARASLPSAAALRDAGAAGGFVAAAAATTRFPPKVHAKPRDAALAAYETASGALLDAWARDTIEAPLQLLLGDLSEAYAAKKRERGVLDFVDLEACAAVLLDRFDERGRTVPGRPRSLLVDEYQDVNRVQARLLNTLRRPRHGDPIDQFAVGDPKQSIYRFRRADVSVMRGELEAAGPTGRAYLRESFRSRPDLVAFHNALFSRLVTPDAAGIAYEPLVAHAKFRGEDRALPPEFILVDATSRPDERALAEARVVAQTIERWVGKEPRTKIERGDDGVERPPRMLRYADVAVLLRSRGRLKSLERALLEAGIPFHVGRGMGFYDAPEIRDLIHMLRAVHDPQDRFALAAHLASPAVGATDGELLTVFSGFSGPTDPLDALRRVPCLAAAAERIDRLRRVAASGSLEDVVRDAIEGADAMATSLVQPGGARRAKNLEKAVEFARRLDDEGGHGLFDLLRVLSRLVAREIDEAEAASGVEGDAVSILTVHGAKGLQWPCVIVADTNRRDPHVRGSFLVGEHGDVGLRLLDPLEGVERSTGAYEAQKALETDAQRQESRRLLYVALTRAEERLVVTASADKRTKDGRPANLSGWAKDLYDTLGATFDVGVREARLDAAPVVLRVVPPPPPPGDAPTAPLFLRHGAEGIRTLASLAPDAETERAAAAHWARVESRPTSLGRTPFIASISEILAFARSPAAYYEERVVGSDESAPSSLVGHLSPERDDPAAGLEAGPDVEIARAERLARWDEGADVVHGIDRAALGRAVHLAIERWDPRSDAAIEDLVRAALGDEMPVVSSEAEALAQAMVRRFVESPTGQSIADALRRRSGDVRREVAFHARIRFPDGHLVAGLDSLLVKGSIDLWLAGPDGGVALFDHKTNAPGARFSDAAALVAHYETQLRLYALAAERVHERAVAGASLLLLDPGWAALGVPVEQSVDVSGDALGRARSLCEAFATALLAGRFPPRWEDLLAR